MFLKVIPINLSISKAYLIIEESPVLVDTGSPNEEQKIQAALEQEGYSWNDLKLIIHTHGHIDHVGSTKKIKSLTLAPTAIHPLDQENVISGNNGPIKPARFAGKILKPFAERSYPSFKPDLLIEEGFSLQEYGVQGKVIHTPGHTKGSISVVLKTGEAIIGDLLMGGHLGGAILSSKPRIHYFAELTEQIEPSFNKLLQHNVHTLYVGHGGPLKMEKSRKIFQK